MEYFAISIPAKPEELDELLAVLAGMGYDSLQIEDEREFFAHSPFWEMTGEELVPRTRVTLYLTEEPDEAFLSAFPGAVVSVVDEESWQNNWKQYYKPILIGERLVIHPEWEPMTDYGGRAVYLSNPGMSFGTGLHATTRLCLEALERMDLSGKRILDIGCGSGILGLCALLLGAESVTAIDIDPLAADITRQNAELNHLSDKVTAFAGNFLADKSLQAEEYDIVCSNIVADVIIALTPIINSPVWLSSGIIDARADEVRDSIAAAGRLIADTGESGGWISFTAVYHKD